MIAPWRLVLADEQPVAAWKNGGGRTAEIAVSPPGAGLSAFDWRVSRAWVDADGPFSIFPGVDRTLAVLSGEGIDLVVGEGPPLRLGPADPPCFFAADAPAHAGLVAGGVTDLNVMTRRAAFRHAVHAMDRTQDIVPADASICLLVCARGRTVVSVSGAGVDLAVGDAVLLAPGHTCAVGILPGSRAFRIDIAPI